MHVLDRVSRLRTLGFQISGRPHPKLKNEQVMSPLEEEGTATTSSGCDCVTSTTTITSMTASAKVTSTATASSAGGSATAVAGAASSLPVQPLAWSLLEALGAMYGYMFFLA